MMNKTHISIVENDQVDEVRAYVIAFRRKLFPMLNPDILPTDLEEFEAFYLNPPTGTFLQARDENNQLIGVIGMTPYDYRFPHLDLDREPTVEVARLFVEPSYRRKGIGTFLFQELQILAKEKEVKRLYLHTHPFLPSAFEFWEKQGFHLLKFCDEGGFPTLHMEKMLLRLTEVRQKFNTNKIIKNEEFI